MKTYRTADDPESASSMIRISRQGFHWEKLIIFVGILGFAFLFVNVQQSNWTTTTHSFSQSTATSLSYDTSNYAIYKHTTSITPGTTANVSAFVNSYITYISLTSVLGCTSIKLVGSLLYPPQDVGSAGFQEIHWVDTTVFENSGKSIEEWNDYIESLGSSNFNNFMHNKVQMYVDDLQPLFNLLRADGVSSTKRLSASAGSSTNDVAHISLAIADSAMMYEIVGPSSSLSTSVLKEEFSEWSSEECPAAHSLPLALDYYQELYSSSSPSDDQKDWMTSSGLRVPMGVRITIPASSLTKMDDTVDLIVSVSNASASSADFSSDQCSVLTLSWDDSSEYFVPQVSYVENNNPYSGTTQMTYSIEDWETEAETSHLELMANSSWDRYIDTHIGMLVQNPDNCDANIAHIEESIQTNAGHFQYSQRESVGSHFYVGNDGLRTWEFNAANCVLTGYEICGCIASNNNHYYYLATGTNCTVDSTTIA